MADAGEPIEKFKLMDISVTAQRGNGRTIAGHPTKIKTIPGRQQMTRKSAAKAGRSKFHYGSRPAGKPEPA
jgi:hypothetical protein